MAGNISSSAIATLASLLIIVPLPPAPALGRPAQLVLDGSPDLAKPPFPVAASRTLALPAIEPFVGFEGTLGPVAITGEPETSVTQAARDPAPAMAAVDPPRPRAAAAQFPVSSVEEFPGAVPVAVPRLAANPKWRRVIEETPQGPHSVECAAGPAERCVSTPWARWHELVRKVSALEGEARLQAANEGINSLLAYAGDDEIYGVGDYWATLAESMARGRGDCEDIAIAKMWLLNAAGIDLSSMRLVVLKDTLRNLDHAVLSVFENGHQYVLDNTAWKVGRADWMRGYRPIYALSLDQSWIYGVRVPTAPPLQVAQSASSPLPQ